MSHKERVLHMVLFELIALMLMTTLATWVTGHGATEMAGLAVTLSLIAMVWNYAYNYGYDHLFGSDRSKRTFTTRILHGLGFEFGMMILTIPVLMWVLQLGFWSVLVMDFGVALFFVLYAIGFNWAYDGLRARLLSGTPTQNSKASI